MNLNDILNALERHSRALDAQAEKLAAERDYSAEFPACDAEALRAAYSMLCVPASGNPAGTPGAKVDTSRLSPGLPPPHGSQEEARGDDAHRDVPFKFHPRAGCRLVQQDRHTRRTSTLKVWDFCPWTGIQRRREDVEDDPQGLALRPPGWPVFAAKKPSALDEMAEQVAGWTAAEKRIVGVHPGLGDAYVGVKPTGIDATLAERGSRYGKFEDHAAITMQLKNALRQRIYENTTKFQADQLEAIDMICHKLGRIVNGDPNYADSWLDIAGYAKLVADRLEGVAR